MPAQTRDSIYSEDSIKQNPAVRLFAVTLGAFLSGVATIIFVDDRYMRNNVAAADTELSQAREQIILLQSQLGALQAKDQLNIPPPFAASPLAQDTGPPCFDLSTPYEKDETGKQSVIIILDREGGDLASTIPQSVLKLPGTDITQCRRPCIRESKVDDGHTIRVPP